MTVPLTPALRERLERQHEGAIPAVARTEPVRAMNKLELAYAGHLEHRRARERTVAAFWFQPLQFWLGPDATRYTPDFLVQLTTGHLELHETKGHWEEDARVKIKVAAGLYPCFTFRAITRRSAGAPWTVETFARR